MSNNINPFVGKKVAVTGKLRNYTRQDIRLRILDLGAIPVQTVTRKTDYLIVGTHAGSKLTKAQAYGIPVLMEWEFEEMIDRENGVQSAPRFPI